MLGLAIYLAYGYTRSAIGQKLGRPNRTPLLLKIAALGFFMLAVGLFTVPHHLGLRGSLAAAASSGAEEHTRSLVGYLLIVVGFLVGIAGSLMGAGQQTTEGG